MIPERRKNTEKTKNRKNRKNFLHLNAINATITGQDNIGYEPISRSGKSF